MNFQCIQNDFIPPLIENENREEYLDCLNDFQINNDIGKFALFLEYCQMQSETSLECKKEIKMKSFNLIA
ncbi:hypothetical protein [Helicobacter turcicus]|uniref:Uncharacterized protein n=1 Tax=Helicobacter turcicus TaxID=2867412 RepID=A0ABS7JN30_9HELI|nr:hypothetical protein [Helicobacter turcicus]MBX7490807.1 hypothetical protein [Helicobacter turcicus]MBX7545584.1 hypothetical protein [Helicobacter turcicus]